jgi:hypothetical protein
MLDNVEYRARLNVKETLPYVFSPTLIIRSESLLSQRFRCFLLSRSSKSPSLVMIGSIGEAVSRSPARDQS